ncbi:MAG: hypothetical protein DMG59_08760 [Acidobacteria bacterium]|nr:MAG: hypothetical protein DMG59_08760 [Acidobacteriota bacterium]
MIRGRAVWGLQNAQIRETRAPGQALTHEFGHISMDHRDADRQQALMAETQAARREYLRISNQIDCFNREVRDRAHGMRLADSLRNIANLRTRRIIAYEKYQRALDAYGKLVLAGRAVK